MPPPHSRYRRFRPGRVAGSVLTLVLIAIALLAALTFTMSRNERGSVPAGEQDAIAAATIMKYSDGLRQAVELVMGNGADVSQISFENGTTSANYANGAATAATKVFDTAGGGMSYAAPSLSWLDPARASDPYYGEWLFPDSFCVPFVGRGADGSGTTQACNADGEDNEELAVGLVYVREDICIRINRELGIPLCSGLPCEQTPGAFAGTTLPYTGSFADGNMVRTGGSADFNGRRQGCLLLYNTASYFYYEVLVAR